MHTRVQSFFLYFKSKPRIINGFFVVMFLCFVSYKALAATPNPGHPWTAIGDGLWAATGTSQYHTFGFPNSDADVLTDYNIVQGDIIYGSAASTTAILSKDTNATRYLSNRGVSNNPSWSTINLSNGVDSILASINGGTGNASTSFTGMTLARTYTLPDANAVILTDNADVTLLQGGTGATLTASNGGIVYSTASALGILAGVASNGKLLMSQNGAAPIWSSATYPSVVTASGSVLVSDGTNVVSQDQTVLSVPTRAYGATGAMTATSMASLTAFKVGLFTVAQTINVNMLSISNTTVTTAGRVKICIYDDAGNKIIDTTATPAGANATISTTTPSAVQLHPGNYYMAVGCAITCSLLINYWTTTTASPLTTLTPTGKKVYEGTVTMTSGTCNATLPAITAAVSSTPVGRLDN
jgi:hypothetical protein